jgi:SusD family.
MKKIISTIITILILVPLAFVSCDLDRFPYSDIELSQGMKNIGDIRKLTDGGYSLLRNGTYGSHMITQDIQADLLHSTPAFGNRFGLPYSWDNFTPSDYDLEVQWELNYRLISNANNVINNHGNIVLEGENDENLLSQFLGEVYFMRALAYSRLVERFAKDYEPTTAENDPGVPLLLEFDIENKPARSSVAAVYDQIFKDIEAARTNFNKVDWSKAVSTTLNNGSNMRFTPETLSSFEARMYLYTHEWDKAIQTAEAVIESGKFPLVSSEADFKAMWVDDACSEIIMHLYGDAEKETVNTNSNYTSYQNNEQAYMPDYIPEKWVVDMYDDEDYRKSAYLLNDVVLLETTKYTDLYILNKYPRTTRFSASGNTFHYPILFRIAEMYLIVAEASSHSTNAAGLKRLNELRAARGLDALTGLSGESLLEAVKVERTKEMLGEGVRLSDLKRWKMPMKRSAPQNEQAALPGNMLKEIPAGHDKFVWGIPGTDIQLNPNLKDAQNPGW